MKPSVSSLDTEPLRSLLARLHRDARRDVWRVSRGLPRAAAAFLRGGGAGAFEALKPVLRDAYIPVSPEMGRFLYLLTRSIGARHVVEFGTSFGISTLYFAAAVRDNGGGCVIGSELEPGKHARAIAHLREAGLDGIAQVRPGDARETLAKDLPTPVDVLLLDGWKDLYEPVLEIVQPALRQGALVLADNVRTFRRTLAPYVRRMQSGAHGFDSVTLPFSTGLEFSICTASAAPAR